MLSETRDELDIQRCVDGELSPEQTRQLLTRLDGMADGWKTLACGLLEDRALSRLMRDGSIDLLAPEPPPQPASADTTVAAPLPARSSASRWRYWSAHPVTSLTLCAAIAFVTGLLIPGSYSFPGSGQTTLSHAGAISGESGSPVASASPTTTAETVANEAPYRVRLMPDGQNSGIEVPAYRPDSQEYLRQLQRHIQQIRQLQGDGVADEADVRLRVVRLPAGDDHDVLFLIDEYELGRTPQ